MQLPFLRWILLPLLSFSVSSGAQAQAPAAGVAAPITSPAFDREVITVGGRLLKIPTPKGFARGDGINPEWDRGVASMLPESNRLLASYGTAAEVDLIRKGTPSDYARNFNIQTVKSVESQEIGERTFGSLRSGVKQGIDSMRSKLDAEMKKLTEKGNKKFEKNFGVNIALSISDTAVLGYFEDTSTSIGFSMVMKVGVQDATGHDESRSVVACLMTPVNGRLINLYSTVPYHGEADQQEAETSVKAWRDAILAVNPRVEGKAVETEGDRIARSVGIGAGVGLFYGLFVWISKKMKRRKEPKSES